MAFERIARLTFGPLSSSSNYTGSAKGDTTIVGAEREQAHIRMQRRRVRVRVGPA